jgi:hypothetical protein
LSSRGEDLDAGLVVAFQEAEELAGDEAAMSVKSLACFDCASECVAVVEVAVAVAILFETTRSRPTTRRAWPLAGWTGSCLSEAGRWQENSVGDVETLEY